MKVNRDEAQNYALNGDFFRLKDDGDSAVVRFLFNKEEDIDDFIASVHTIEENKRMIDIDCIRRHDEPADLCPLCRDKIKLAVKLYLPLWDEDKQKVVWWTRSRGFIDKVVAQLREVDGPICGTPFKITRSGAAGSFDTDYAFIQQVKKADDKEVKDFVKPEELTLEAAGVTILTERQMEDYIDTGKLPNKEVKTRERGGKGNTGRTGRRDIPADNDGAGDDDIRRRADRGNGRDGGARRRV